jgi:mediator of RNA polymerase II transcription subunit 6
MAPRVPPLDEIEWEDPHVIPGLGFGPELNTQNILWYFTNSPFFDAGSNNMSLLGHAQNAPDRDRIFGNRLAFEEALRDRYPTGFQFVVTSEPKAEGEPWVIQRQQKTRDAVSGEIVTEIQGTYFTVGNKVFMAPSLLDIVRSRMVWSSKYKYE